MAVIATKTFSYNSLRSATGDFHPSSKIGGGGYGVVYKVRVGNFFYFGGIMHSALWWLSMDCAVLDYYFFFPHFKFIQICLLLCHWYLQGVLKDGTQVAIKSLSVESKQGTREFMTEIDMISSIQHPNLVQLIGCCVEGNHRMLVYEFMENNSLASTLLGKYQNNLNFLRNCYVSASGFCNLELSDFLFKI